MVTQSESSFASLWCFLRDLRLISCLICSSSRSAASSSSLTSPSSPSTTSVANFLPYSQGNQSSHRCLHLLALQPGEPIITQVSTSPHGHAGKCARKTEKHPVNFQRSLAASQVLFLWITILISRKKSVRPQKCHVLRTALCATNQ